MSIIEREIRTIYGPPGTGKTRTLVEYAVKEAGEYPDRVLFVSFSKAAATEATSRLEHIKPMTLHSCAYRAIDAAPAMVVNRAKMFAFSRLVGVPVSGAEENTSEEQQEGDQYIAVMSYAQHQMIPFHDAYERKGSPGTRERFDMFHTAYHDWKEAYGFIDFDDMLIRGIEHIKSSPIVMVDEAQDCSPLQWKFITKLTRDSRRVYVAGDDDQAIFEWSGADPHGMMKFSEQVKSKTRVLDQSHRVPKSVHKFAHKSILARIDNRVDKEFKARPAPGTLLRYASMENIDIAQVVKRHDVMILVRDRYRMIEAETELAAQNIPYNKVGGYSPYSNRYAHAIRAIRKPEAADLTKDEAEALRYFNVTRKVTDWHGIIPIPISLRDFYDHADLDAPVKVTLSTIHQAKGKESGAVIVDLTLGDRSEIEATVNPDAERRVMYVAVTRAKEELHLCGENSLI